MREPLLDKLDRKIGRYALRNLMMIIVVGTGIVWLLETIVSAKTETSILWYLYFSPTLILEGQVWRLVTFLFVPDTFSLFSLALSLYLDWLIGSALENQWGSLKFDLFYLCGWLGAVASGFITGYATNYYLHLSMFLAFALLYPDFTLYIFFILPVKMKWLAVVCGIGLAVLFILEGWAGRLALIMALLNVLLFFWGVMWRSFRQYRRRKKWQKEARRKDDNNYPFDL